eukprot:10727832-Ditylum_brightwellii.AAC.1
MVLCVSNLCAYKLKEGSGVTDAWISKYVCPSIMHVYGKGIPHCLGRVFYLNHHVSQAWCHLVVAEYNKIPSHHCLDDGEIPVVKCCFVVWEYEGSPHFDTIQEDESQEGRED